MNILGQSSKTTFLGYLLAVIIAVQPFITETVDFSTWQSTIKFILQMVAAALMAILGKQAADSSQVKETTKQVVENTERLDRHRDEINEITEKAKVKPVRKKAEGFPPIKPPVLKRKK